MTASSVKMPLHGIRLTNPDYQFVPIVGILDAGIWAAAGDGVDAVGAMLGGCDLPSLAPCRVRGTLLGATGRVDVSWPEPDQNVAVLRTLTIGGEDIRQQNPHHTKHERNVPLRP